MFSTARFDFSVDRLTYRRSTYLPAGERGRFGRFHADFYRYHLLQGQAHQHPVGVGQVADDLAGPAAAA